MKTVSTYLLIATVLIFSGCSDEAIFRSDKPLTRVAAAKELIGFPFPASTRSVYYLMYSGGLQDMEQYIRFDVNPKELDRSVDALVAWNNKEMKRSLPYPRASLSSATAPTPEKSFLPMPWWDPSTITTGYFRGHVDGYALRIFVDQARSRIYVYQND